MSEEEIALAMMEASQLTEESVAEKFKALGDKPSPTAVQEILGIIAYVADDTKRAILFTVAKQAVKGPLKAMVAKAETKANKYWKERLKAQAQAEAQNQESAKREAATSEIPVPWWGKGYYKYNGRTFVYGPRQDNGDYDLPLHSALRFLSSATYPDRTVQGQDHVEGIIIEFENRKGNIRSLAFPRSQALSPTTNKDGLIQDLTNAGVSFTTIGMERVREAVLSAGDLGEGGEIYDSPGWKGDIFVTPGGKVIGKTNLDIRLHRPLLGIKQAGTLDKWREATAKAFCPEVLDNAPQIPVALLFGFVSPLIDRADEEASLILSLAGRTTRLKTYSLRLKASVWGTTLAKHGRGILGTFNTTANKLEESAIERTGCGMATDDSTLTTAEILSPFIYRLVTGMERGRKNEEGRPWTIACTLTSEVPILQFLRAGGVEPPPGLMSRLIEIPILDNRISDEPIDTLAGAFSNYGHAGPAFVEAMIAGGWCGERIKAAVKERVSILLGGTGDREQSRRASRVVAYIWLAGDIAQEARLIPADFDVKAFAVRLWDIVKGGANTSDNDVGRVKHALAQGLLDGSIPIHSDNGIALSTGEGSGAICKLNFGRNDEAVFVLTSPALAKIVGGRVTVKDVAQILDNEGILYREQKDRLTWKSGRTGVGEVASYVLYARAVLGEDAEDMIKDHWSARRGSGPNLGVVVGLNREAS